MHAPERWIFSPSTLGETSAGRPAVGPRIVVRRGAIARILNTPEMKENLAKQGAEVYTMSSEQLGNWLKSEIEKWAKVVKAANLKLE